MQDDRDSPQENDTKALEMSLVQCREESDPSRLQLSHEGEVLGQIKQLVTQTETTIQHLLSETSLQNSQLRQEKDSQIQQLRQQLADLGREKQALVQHYQQCLSDLREDKEAQVQQHQQQLSDLQREKEARIQQLQQNLSDIRRESEAQIQQHQQQLSDLRRENEARIQQLQQHLSDLRREKEAQTQQHQQHLSDLRRENELLQQGIGPNISPSHSQEMQFWHVSAEEVQVDQEILGGGAWGVVAKGKFRGQRVAVKQLYPNILQPTTVDRVRREISTMAQVRHPNLVLFIAAVMDGQTGPMIITEILDTNLRTAYERNCLGSNKLRIFQDLASALNYLHLHREPIIHRDVSTANVLLEAVANNGWKAKLSDFGSANLVRYATTPGEGAIIYTAPEAFPQPPTSPTPSPPQTPKIDVYSYGVVLGEVVTQQLPDPSRLQEMMRQVRRQWPQLHPTVTSCIQYSPESRPSMAHILQELNGLNRTDI